MITIEPRILRAAAEAAARAAGVATCAGQLDGEAIVVRVNLLERPRRGWLCYVAGRAAVDVLKRRGVRVLLVEVREPGR